MGRPHAGAAIGCSGHTGHGGRGRRGGGEDDDGGGGGGARLSLVRGSHRQVSPPTPTHSVLLSRFRPLCF
jgi:hypothetical protein